MSAAAIKAGKAWVELALKDKTDDGLANVKRKFLRWGAGLAAAGAAITAAAGGILSAFTGAAKIFADAGSQVYDLSKATGASAEQLSALGYAAEQSGASAADVASTFKGLAKFTAQVTAGSKASATALDQLGLSSQQFLAATPYDRLLLIADALQKIPDPGLRSAVAMQTLGRGAMELGSLLSQGAAGVRELVAEAERLGLVVTSAEAEKADALGDAWGAVGKQLKQVAFVTGSALAGVLTDLAKAIQPVLAGVIQFVRENPGLVKGLAIAAVAVGALGGALLAIGGVLIAGGALIASVSAIFAAVPAILAAVGAAVGALLTPFGLVAASLVALGVALVGSFTYWAAFDKGVQTLLGGIWNAIAKGDWTLAGKIMMAALNAGWQGGLLQARTLWEGFKSWLYRLFGEMLTQLATFLDKTVAGLKAVASYGKLVGLDLSNDFGGVTELSQQLRRIGGNLPRIAEIRSGKNLAGPQEQYRTAVMDLARLLAQAAVKAKTPKAPENAAAFPDVAAAATHAPGSALGTFSGAIAGMLRESATSLTDKAALRTAAATERTAKATEATQRELEDFGKDEE